MEAMEQTAKKKMNSKVDAYSTESKAKIDDAIAKIQRALRAAKSNFDVPHTYLSLRTYPRNVSS